MLSTRWVPPNHIFLILNAFLHIDHNISTQISSIKLLVLVWSSLCFFPSHSWKDFWQWRVCLFFHNTRAVKGLLLHFLKQHFTVFLKALELKFDFLQISLWNCLAWVSCQAWDVVKAFSPLRRHTEGGFLLWKCYGVLGYEFTLYVWECINKGVFPLPGQVF